jgi:ketosteroid isomerase-like protein
MRRCIYGLVMLTATGVLSGCMQSTNVEQERAALLAKDKEWSGSMSDPEKYFSYYAADATVYPTGMPKVSGTQAIRDGMTQIMSIPGFALQWTPVRAEVSASGDIGYTTGTTVVTMNNGAGNPVTERGKYLQVWKKQADGQWKVTEDIFNSDEPSMAPSAAHVTTTSAALKWGDAPPSLPPGGKMAVVSGDPSKPGPFTIRAQLPSGYKIAPHWHPADENVTVLSGTFLIGMGETYDEAKMTELGTGGYVGLPGSMRHYATTKGPTTIQVHGMGPFALNYVNPADDPSKK